MRVTCVVDDQVMPHSSLRAEHGLAMVVESQQRRLLFDTGPDGDLLLHNLRLAGIDPDTLSAVVLSHAHQDHTGGLPALLARKPGLPVYAHSDLGRMRFSRRDGEMKAVGLPVELETLQEQADLRLSAGRSEVLPGVWTSGAITQRPEPEGRSRHHFVREKGEWLPDPYRDDQALVLETEQGLVLLCGCCHAGLLNTVQHVEREYGASPVVIAGGLHLLDAGETAVRRVAEALKARQVREVYPNHCTGETAYIDLALVLGVRVAPFPAGAVLEI